MAGQQRVHRSRELVDIGARRDAAAAAQLLRRHIRQRPHQPAAVLRCRVQVTGDTEIEQHHRQLREQNEQLQQANEVLEQLSITDGLTKLHNHRYFQETLTREIKRVSRTGETLALLLIDIDDFKALNDRLGHAAGDAVLVRIARILNESVRESDVLARYGGEEFVVLAPGTDLEGVAYLAEKVRTAVAEALFGLDPAGEPMRVTVSIGVAEYAGDRRAFFDVADRALYRAKAAGKNCVAGLEELGRS